MSYQLVETFSIKAHQMQLVEIRRDIRYKAKPREKAAFTGVNEQSLPMKRFGY
ncbi:MAG: hypothetical protein KUG80_05630 [Gammaproteobacteria bacterium]|nr:hypothetical protein [Gammaproteobacteria bacterium]